MNLTTFSAATVMMFLAGCGSEVDKCVAAQMKVHAAAPSPKNSAVEAEADARIYCLQAANGKL
jgi:hypothetical protein